jgi:hypothetical protein
MLPEVSERQTIVGLAAMAVLMLALFGAFAVYG